MCCYSYTCTVPQSHISIMSNQGNITYKRGIASAIQKAMNVCSSLGIQTYKYKVQLNSEDSVMIVFFFSSLKERLDFMQKWNDIPNGAFMMKNEKICFPNIKLCLN